MRPGLYGKLPSQGDFVSRRLPWEFTSGWDVWLQAGMIEARRQLGEAWLDRYLTAPIWRFQLAPGVLGAGGWIGLWFPSVDRVGRHFPLTLAVPLAAHLKGRYAVLEFEATLVAWEDAALQALDPAIGFDTFDALLESLPAAAWLDSQSVPAVPSELGPVAPIGAEDVLVFDATSDAAAVLERVRSEPVQSCFFSWGGDALPPTLCRSAGLLPSAAFHGFFSGNWPHRGSF